MFFDFFLDGKFSCSPFIDIQHDIDEFESMSSYKSSSKVAEIQKELSILKMTYLLFGLLLNEYPTNYAFELTSRLVILFGIKPEITKLIQQCDEQSPRHCALIVPYYQIQPPGNGLIYSMNKHTMPVVDLDFTKNQMTAISLSDKIIVINMSTGNTALNVKLPKLDEPYLNSTTLPKMIMHYATNNNENNDMESDITSDSGDSDDDDDDDEEKFKQYMFLVNSRHHVYLISSCGDITFQKTSTKGYLTVEVFHSKLCLCILVEQNSNSVECWNIVQNKLFSKINVSPTAFIKTVLLSKLSSEIVITIVLYDGTIFLHVLNGSTFVHRGTINAGNRLDLVVVDQDKLICTFDSTVSIDFAHIDLNVINEKEQMLFDKDFTKALISFDPPISPKPLQRIILPDDKDVSGKELNIFFMVLTKECLYLVHVCQRKEISYASIPGQFDVVSAHAQNVNFVYAARGGIINMYKWKCSEGEDDEHVKFATYHRIQLFVSIDISSSPVLTIKPSGDSGKSLLQTKKSLHRHRRIFLRFFHS